MVYASRMIITFAALKGGVGKTTGTVYLGAALSEHGTVQLIDTDPQRSLTMWAQEAGEGFPTVKTILDRAVTRADAAGFDFTVIDTPPGNPDAINAAVAVADLVFVPTRPSHLDARHTAKFVESLAQAQIPASVLVVGAEPRRRALRDVREFLTDLPGDSSLYEHVVPHRAHAITAAGTLPPRANLHPYDLIAEELKGSI